MLFNISHVHTAILVAIAGFEGHLFALARGTAFGGRESVEEREAVHTSSVRA